jgi:hypothetical protein
MEAIGALSEQYKVRELALFGSALGEALRPDSDLDFLVESQPEAQIGFTTLTRMERDLSAILHRRVDLVPKEGLKPRIRQAVLSSARVLYAA